ncbi:hypothetical protein H0A71_21870 [Alcaligenaceae bacterium]|nr:hypothetical protein [Alcaligenaceae bacterium]
MEKSIVLRHKGIRVNVVLRGLIAAPTLSMAAGRLNSFFHRNLSQSRIS